MSIADGDSWLSSSHALVDERLEFLAEMQPKIGAKRQKRKRVEIVNDE